MIELFDVIKRLGNHVNKHVLCSSFVVLFCIFCIITNSMFKSNMFAQPFTALILFFVFFGTWHKIGSFRLPTHSRDAYRKFFGDPFLN